MQQLSFSLINGFDVTLNFYLLYKKYPNSSDNSTVRQSFFLNPRESFYHNLGEYSSDDNGIIQYVFSYVSEGVNVIYGLFQAITINNLYNFEDKSKQIIITASNQHSNNYIANINTRNLNLYTYINPIDNEYITLSDNCQFELFGNCDNTNVEPPCICVELQKLIPNMTIVNNFSDDFEMYYGFYKNNELVMTDYKKFNIIGDNLRFISFDDYDSLQIIGHNYTNSTGNFIIFPVINMRIRNNKNTFLISLIDSKTKDKIMMLRNELDLPYFSNNVNNKISYPPCETGVQFGSGDNVICVDNSLLFSDSNRKLIVFYFILLGLALIFIVFVTLVYFFSNLNKNKSDSEIDDYYREYY